MKLVLIYTTPTCVYCVAAKEFFKKNNIAYTEYNVLTDMARREEMIENSEQMGVPVIMVDDEIIVGFDKPKIVQLLGIK